MIEQQESVTERLDRLEQRMDELKERVKMLEQDVSFVQSCKALALMGYRLTIQLSKAGNDHSCDGSKVTEDTKEGISMAVEIQEKKATLEISRSNDGYTECQKFNFKLPVSGDYEIEFSEIILDSDEYTKLYTSGINVRYSQGVLYLNIERTDEEGFCFEVKDAKHYYKAMRYYKNMEQHIEVEGIEVHITEDKPEGEGK